MIKILKQTIRKILMTTPTKEDDSENAKEKLKDISNTFKALIFDMR